MSDIRVLLVCAGNTCRSPMAGGLPGEFLQRSDVEAEVRTAGLSPGGRVNPHAVAVMKDIGIDISHHTPKRITKELVEWATYIVPMTRELGADLVDSFPEASRKMRWLEKDVDDPVSEQTASRYCETRDQLRTVLTVLAEELKK